MIVATVKTVGVVVESTVRAGLGEAQFGMLVKVAPSGDDLGHGALHCGVHAGRIDLSLSGDGRQQRVRGKAANSGAYEGPMNFQPARR